MKTYRKLTLFIVLLLSSVSFYITMSSLIYGSFAARLFCQLVLIKSWLIIKIKKTEDICSLKSVRLNNAKGDEGKILSWASYFPSVYLPIIGRTGRSTHDVDRFILIIIIMIQKVTPIRRWFHKVAELNIYHSTITHLLVQGCVSLFADPIANHLG